MMINSKNEVTWFNHYASKHEILLVGDGDFSFSLCVAKAFGSASNIVAISLDTYDAVISKYKNAVSNIYGLKRLGAQVLHGVDATKMNLCTDLQMRKFDRIVFNFPHAGFYGKEDDMLLIKKHRDLVHGFFRNASIMLKEFGEVHVNHKTTSPFCHWHLEELASYSSLLRIDCVDFKIADYPGYNNKRGDGSRCDEPFPLGEARTYKFIFFSGVKKRVGGTNPLTSISPNILHQPICLHPKFASNPGDVTFGNHGSLPIHSRISHDCYRTFTPYLDHAVPIFGRASYDEAYYVRKALRHGSELHHLRLP